MDLFSLRGRIRQHLIDSAAEVWTTDVLDEAVRQAIAEYSRVRPYRAVTTLTVAAATRELSTSTISNLLAVERVWHPYTAASPEYPPNWRNVEYWRDSAILYFPDGVRLAVGDKARVFYTTLHTLMGLDGASATTLPTEDELLILTGSVGYTATSRAIDLMEQVTHDRKIPEQVQTWGASKMEEFRAGLNSLARRLAVQGSAFVEMPELDKYDRVWS